MNLEKMGVFKKRYEMKKKLLLLFTFITIFHYFCPAQQFGGRMKRAEGLFIGYMTKQLDLTPKEAETFWPVYRNYIGEIRSKKRENKKAMQDDPLALEEEILNIRKKYKSDFKKVLESDERVNKMFVAEQTFKEILRRELMNRRMKNQGFNNQQ